MPRAWGRCFLPLARVGPALLKRDLIRPLEYRRAAAFDPFVTQIQHLACRRWVAPLAPFVGIAPRFAYDIEIAVAVDVTHARFVAAKIQGNRVLGEVPLAVVFPNP